MIEKIAVKSGYYFLLFDKNDVPETLQKSSIQVELGEKIYDLYTGSSLEDERKIDDMFGDRMGYSISEHEILEKEF
ncbi:MAG: hypothetical protein IJJ82_07175 [Clostridia bacterium]|nr:hypothetical protein [Clostridia bacterium]